MEVCVAQSNLNRFKLVQYIFLTKSVFNKILQVWKRQQQFTLSFEAKFFVQITKTVRLRAVNCTSACLGKLNSFLSHGAFRPLARLCYSVYLISVTVQYTQTGAVQVAPAFSFLDQVSFNSTRVVIFHIEWSSRNTLRVQIFLWVLDICFCNIFFSNNGFMFLGKFYFFCCLQLTFRSPLGPSSINELLL